MWLPGFFNLFFHSWSVPLIEITDLPGAFKWDNMQHRWRPNTTVSPLQEAANRFQNSSYATQSCSGEGASLVRILPFKYFPTLVVSAHQAKAHTNCTDDVPALILLRFNQSWYFLASKRERAACLVSGVHWSADRLLQARGHNIHSWGPFQPHGVQPKEKKKKKN